MTPEDHYATAENMVESLLDELVADKYNLDTWDRMLAIAQLHANLAGAMIEVDVAPDHPAHGPIRHLKAVKDDDPDTT